MDTVIQPVWASVMAQYNKWQNQNMIDAAGQLTDSQRRSDKGAFFGSIHDTLEHILWADQAWMARLAGFPAPGGTPGQPLRTFSNWASLIEARLNMDNTIIDWADALSQDDLAGELEWYSLAKRQTLRTPLWVCVVHLFNHQTHHRGQVHAMLTASGIKPNDTDLPLLPDSPLGPLTVPASAE